MIQRRRLLIIAASLIGVLLLTGTLVQQIMIPRWREELRVRAVTALEERFGRSVELKTLDVRVFPDVAAEGTGLVIHQKQDEGEVPAFLSIAKFHARSDVRSLLRDPLHIRDLRLEGLEIHIPPRKDTKDKPLQAKDKEAQPKFVINEVHADGTKLYIHPKESWKAPLLWDLYRLKLESAGTATPMKFKATLQNGKPKGLIETGGEFGPWSESGLGETPVKGEYTFNNADLSDFKGIAGILSSEGSYTGILERLEVTGSTDTPDFRLVTSGNPMSLKTEFHAVVDGTTGDTLLQPVDAELGKSKIIAKGGVVNRIGTKGKTVAIDATVADGRLEDILLLAVKSQRPVLSGPIQFQAKFEIPPGEEDVIKKMQMQGQFVLASTRFASPDLQERINRLSSRSLGNPKDPDPDAVASRFRGNFTLRSGTLRLPALRFSMPGADVQLAGNYGLVSEVIDFRGTLRLKAKLSQLTTGVKSFFLKAVDPFFSKEGAGTVLPIRITGTRSKPSFGLNFRGKKK